MAGGTWSAGKSSRGHPGLPGGGGGQSLPVSDTPQPTTLTEPDKVHITFSFLVASILALSSSMCAVASPRDLGPPVPPNTFRRRNTPRSLPDKKEYAGRVWPPSSQVLEDQAQSFLLLIVVQPPGKASLQGCSRDPSPRRPDWPSWMLMLAPGSCLSRLCWAEVPSRHAQQPGLFPSCGQGTALQQLGSR